jgi:ABC-2 type transport system permease protein
MKRFWTTFRYTFASLRGQILGWGIGVGLYGLMIIPMYETMAVRGETFKTMIASYPPEFLAFFGATVNSMLTPGGFLGMYAFSMLPVIVGIFAVIAGSGLIVGDEERGRLDLILAHPVGRTAFFLGRTLGLTAGALAIHLLAWLGFSLLLGKSSMGFNMGQMLVPFLPLLVQIIFFTILALLLSLLLPSRNLAAMTTGAIMVISYVISSMAFMDARLTALARWMPYHYFQTVMSFQDLNSIWLLSLLGIAVVMTAAAWLLFLRRDIRLSGEGSWKPLHIFRTRKSM